MTPPPVALWSTGDPKIIGSSQNRKKDYSTWIWPRHPGHHLLQVSVQPS